MSEREPAGRLVGRTVVLGVSGSIAAYKAAELCRALQGEGATVQALMTHSATRFLGPLTLETLTGLPVMTDPLELLPDRRIGHIVAADSADVVVVAPATARWIAAMASGMADDVITAAALASKAPLVIAPAMDGEMYAHPATRRNVARLREDGARIVEPEVGPLASGQVGQGRLAATERIVDAVVEALAGRRRDLEGRRVVVTAGGTAEPIDPVRFVGNRSTGRMGVAIAEAALARGAAVTFIAGTTSVPLPDAARIMPAPTAAEMRDAVLAALPGADALIMAAAVADFRPAQPAAAKLPREAGLSLTLESTDDILAEAARLARAEAAAGRPRPVLVGFAAETGSLERAAEKAERKGVDLLLANDVAEEGSGFGSETNRVTLIVPGRDPVPWPLLSKRQVADRLLDLVAAHLESRAEPDAMAEAAARAPATN